jgi:hypothetical protein
MDASCLVRSAARASSVPSAAAIALAAASAAQSQLWVVDDGGGPLADFTSIQAGIDASVDGDVVLVRAGTYGGFAIEGKGIAVVGEAPGVVLANEATVSVRNTLPSQSVLLQNLRVRGGPFSIFGGGERALVIEGCLGLVSVQDCVLEPNGTLAEGGGAQIDGSAAVSLTRCTLLGGADVQVMEPGHALVVSASSIAAYDCAFVGGQGPGGPCTFGCGPATAAGDGANLEGSALFASGSSFDGGDGQDGFPPCSFPSLGGEGADGGDGVRLTGGSALTTLACSFSHGAAGDAASPSSCSSGVEGLDVDLSSGTHTVLTGIARSLDATSPIVEGGVTTLTLAGAPGDLAFANVALKPGFLPLPVFQGVMLTSSTQFFTVFLGAVPAGGTLSIPVQTVPHGGPDEVVIQHLQSGWFTALGEIRLGGNASVVIQK